MRCGRWRSPARPRVGWFLGGLPGQAALAVAGDPSPWRPGFLDELVARGLLVAVDGERRFVHLLVREHLAACDPCALASAVAQRRTELVGR